MWFVAIFFLKFETIKIYFDITNISIKYKSSPEIPQFLLLSGFAMIDFYILERCSEVSPLYTYLRHPGQPFS